MIRHCNPPDWFLTPTGGKSSFSSESDNQRTTLNCPPHRTKQEFSNACESVVSSNTLLRSKILCRVTGSERPWLTGAWCSDCYTADCSGTNGTVPSWRREDRGLPVVVRTDQGFPRLARHKPQGPSNVPPTGPLAKLASTTSATEGGGNHLPVTCHNKQWPLLLTWINFNPCMDK